jgi:predicted amidophosphoribosyltransferase
MSKKECPSCAMEIDTIEKFCPVCGYEFPVTGKGYIIVAIILLLVIILYWVF